MTQERQGQKLINHIRKRFGNVDLTTFENRCRNMVKINNIIWNMSDLEFNHVLGLEEAEKK